MVPSIIHPWRKGVWCKGHESHSLLNSVNNSLVNEGHLLHRRGAAATDSGSILLTDDDLPTRKRTKKTRSKSFLQLHLQQQHRHH
ncbi:putative calmodulin-binding transcription activator 2 isoform [Sesbania bispinosa]|nr:putative calmodulin-binding transcription activator 2 isoform [Sesbania bispinosa]